MRRLVLVAVLLILLLLPFLPGWLFLEAEARTAPVPEVEANPPTRSGLRIALSEDQLRRLLCRGGERVTVALSEGRLRLSASIAVDGDWVNLNAGFGGSRTGLALADLEVAGRAVDEALLPGLWAAARQELPPRLQTLLRNLRDVELGADSLRCTLSRSLAQAIDRDGHF